MFRRFLLIALPFATLAVVVWAVVVWMVAPLETREQAVWRISQYRQDIANARQRYGPDRSQWPSQEREWYETVKAYEAELLARHPDIGEKDLPPDPER